MGKKEEHRHEAHIVAVDMGYGHERPARSLAHLAVRGEGVIIANNYKGIPDRDKLMWRKTREFYETLSRSKSVPLVGNTLFDLLVDSGQRIEPFYPSRDLSKPSVQLKNMYRGIKMGLGRHLIDLLAQNPVPIITTFFFTAFMAEEYDYPGDIWCVTTDADISRAWAPLDPKRSRIKYVAANGRCAERLKLYGVRGEHIYLTGFPLPREIVDGPEPRALKQDLVRRLCALDPKGFFRERYRNALDVELGRGTCPKTKRPSPPRLMFAVGGAGAQARLGDVILKSFASSIRRGQIVLELMAGARPQLGRVFKESARRLRLERALDRYLIVSAWRDRSDYFAGFNTSLRRCDVLWTKPSELSFYTGLGLPIILAPPVGSQEEFNRLWLGQIGGGVDQYDPRYAGEWFFDWLDSGALARMAWNGYIEAPTHGAFRIESCVFGEKTEVEPLPIIV
ncbi:MAG: hypothetical protein UY95_C0008G0002 [Parcubacteria group bacterium GW2011_GWA2_56_7]|nr:MAG: hypothetical protein UY95_C0008G0002 [Parcubacteria group bacterium GW2011_GWA2_56_7]